MTCKTLVAALILTTTPLAAQAQFIGMGRTLGAVSQISTSLEKSCLGKPGCGQTADLTTRADTTALATPPVAQPGAKKTNE
ncbi:hypothetical protein [Pseudoruegeria sp. SHC-113]|uniref:hypothetical protein n=1 Tax=Pseudoruegeria sp. SHC-113 TaxID=2855439 RepID=UPI0021BB586E|nr:hypothetical protein [Pseudoruegeria sp. SHC-113]MCT8160963.1 hypothetical protein [Pseudoruegeria sp. SHC-113]